MPYNADLLKILQGLEPVEDEASNQAMLGALTQLATSPNLNEFQTRLRLHAGVLKLAIDPALLNKDAAGNYPPLPADFIQDEASVGNADGFLGLTKLAETQQARFTELAAEQARIEGLNDLDKLTEIVNFKITNKNTESFLQLIENAEPHASHLKISDCTLIQKSAQKRQRFLQAGIEIPGKIQNATDAGKDVDALIADIDARILEIKKSAQAAQDALVAQEDLVVAAKAATDNAQVGFFSLNKKEETQKYEEQQRLLAYKNVTLSDVQVACRTAQAKVALAEEKVKLVRDLKLQAEDKIAKAQAEGNPITACKLADEAQQAYLKIKGEVESVKLAQREAENEKNRAADPDNKMIQRQRANLLIERNGSMGFTDVIVRAGGPKPKGEKSVAAGGVVLSTGQTEFDAVRLNSGDTIHSTQIGAGGGIIRLVQDWQGQVTDQTDHAKATPKDKAMAAVKQAKMLLVNYKPEQGPVYIRGGTPDQANRVYAALLCLSQNNPEIQLSPSAIVNCVAGCSSVGTFERQVSFINAQLQGLTEGERQQEASDLKTQRDSFKTKYQGVTEVKDLPDTPGFDFGNK